MEKPSTKTHTRYIAQTIHDFINSSSASKTKAISKPNRDSTILPCQSDPNSTLRRDMLWALLRNSPLDFMSTLQKGADPNFVISVGTAEQGYLESILDKIFLVKKILGESPTLLHVAVLNVYHRCSYSKSFMLPRQRNLEIDKARQILKLLLQFSGNAYSSSKILFSYRISCFGGSITPCELSEHIQMIADFKSLPYKTITALQSTMSYMKTSDVDEKRQDGENLNENENDQSLDEQGYQLSRSMLDEVCFLIFGNNSNRSRKDEEFKTKIIGSGGLTFVCTDEYSSRMDEEVRDSSSRKT